MTYPGGKAGDGVYQTIINLMPPHQRYVEAFVGGGAILLRKKPATCSTAIDVDADVAARWQKITRAGRLAGVTAVHGDARSIIPDFDCAGTLIYCDPPYVPSTLKGPQRYRCKFTEADHAALLAVLKKLRLAMVMLSGYRCPLYDRELVNWRRIDYQAATRAGPVNESLWMNFTAPTQLHDYSYVGANYRERERIKKRIRRLRTRLAALPELERAALCRAVLELAPPDPRRRRSPGAAVPDLQASGPEKSGP